MPSSSLGDDRHRFPFEDDVPGGQDGAVAAVGHGGARALPLAHPLLHQRLDRRRRGLRHHKLKFFSSGAPQKTASNNLYETSSLKLCGSFIARFLMDFTSQVLKPPDHFVLGEILPW